MIERDRISYLWRNFVYRRHDSAVLLTTLTQNVGLSLKLSTLDTATSNSVVSLTTLSQNPEVLLAPELLKAFIFFKKNNKSRSKDELYTT